jgi:1-acylglycerone phosphate reductase
MPKTVFITGCGPGGIGAALAAEFHRRGHRVFASGLSEDLLMSFKETGMQTIVMDVTSGSSIKDAVAEVKKVTDGKLDILINNAGIIQVLPFADMDMDDVRRSFDVNVIGLMAVTQAFLPLLIASDSKGGSVVANLCSVNTIFRPAFFCTYNASKAAVDVFGATIRAELAPLGVRVVTLRTGSIKTGLFVHDEGVKSKVPEGSLYAPLKEWIEGKKMLEYGWWTTPENYATRVVSDLLKPSTTGVLWRGGLATVAWLLSWLPEWTMVS